MTCPYCLRSVDPDDRYALQRVVGWEKRAPSSSSRRGGADVVLREKRQEWAHGHCVERQKMGVPAQQGALL